MKTTPFWIYDYPRPNDLPVAAELPEETDVAIIGGGYTGLSAARTLAKGGANVAVLERETLAIDHHFADRNCCRSAADCLQWKQ